MRVEINRENNFVIHENESPQSVGTQLETIEKIFNKQLDSANKIDRAKDFARLKDWAEDAYNKDQSSRKLRRITDFLASTVIGQLLGIQTESMKLRERISSIMQKNGTIYKEIGRYGCQEQDPQKRMNYFTSLKKEWENLSNTGKVPAKYNGMFEKFLVEVDNDKKDNDELLKFSAALGKNSRIKRIIESRVSIPKEYPIQGAKEWKELKEAGFAPASNLSYQQFIQDILKGTHDPDELIKIFKLLNKEQKPFLCLCALIRLNELAEHNFIAYDKEIIEFLALHKAPKKITEDILKRFLDIPKKSTNELKYLIAGAIEGKNNEVFKFLKRFVTDEEYIKACEKGLPGVSDEEFLKFKSHMCLADGLAAAMKNNKQIAGVLIQNLREVFKTDPIHMALFKVINNDNVKIDDFADEFKELLPHLSDDDKKELIKKANDSVIIQLIKDHPNPIAYLKSAFSVGSNDDLVRTLLPKHILLLSELTKDEDQHIDEAIKKVLTIDNYDDATLKGILKDRRLAEIVKEMPQTARIRQLQLSL
jgi:hypothetical protein